MDPAREIVQATISQNTCLKNFKCYCNNCFENIKVRAINEGKKLLECIDESSDVCEFPFTMRVKDAAVEKSVLLSPKN